METITKETPKETFEVPETAAAVKLPTPEEAKAEGLTADEIERAEKRGLVAKPEEKKEEPAKVEAEPEAKKEEPKTEDHNRREEDKAKSSLPDFTFKTPEQEKVFLDAFGAGTPQRAMYFRMKNERQARQAAEKRAEELENRIKALETAKPAVETQELDELGNPIDPEDKPLTIKQLRELQKKESEEIERKNKENQQRAATVSEAQQTQEDYMRSVHEDFDDAVKLTTDLVKNLDSLVKDEWQKEEVIDLVRKLQVAAAQADKIDLDRNHAARIAYRIAKFHPHYGQKADTKPVPNGDSADKDGKSPNPKKANGGLTPEQMKRIEENTNRRASSASVQGGGGSRSISADDVDAATLDKMPYSDRQKFKQKHPDLYAKLLRG